MSIRSTHPVENLSVDELVAGFASLFGAEILLGRHADDMAGAGVGLPDDMDLPR